MTGSPVAVRIAVRGRVVLVRWGVGVLDLAWVSLAALAVTVVLSCTTKVNPGVIAVVFASAIGVYLHPAGTQALGLKGVVLRTPRRKARPTCACRRLMAAEATL